MNQRRPVVILGGGMAALAAAYELSRDGLEGEYEVTVFQPGWLLGGKCASTRGPHPADAASLRVEEHGLHVWFGFYFNAFSMMHDCYGGLADARLTFDLMFRRRSSTPMMEPQGLAGQWGIWPWKFPEDAAPARPGDVPGFPSLDQVMRRLLGFYSERVAGLIEDVQGNFLLLPALAGPLVALAEAVPDLAPGTPAGQVVQDLQQFLDFTAPHWQTVFTTLDGLAGLGLISSSVMDKLRRAWILGDLALAMVNGMSRELLALAARGFDALDDRDFRDWLRAHGARPSSVDSAPIRALYDLCFAYTDGDPSTFDHADFAAGTALRTMVRIGMGYTGAVCYSMNAGMGEAVIAPLYRLLKQRGVQFRFFHRADRIELDGTGLPVRLHFTRQAAVQGNGEYQPLVAAAASLDHWPVKPLFGQLQGGAALQQAWMPDMEDETVAWPGQQPDVLELRPPGGPIVDLVLAVSPGSLERMTQDLIDRHPQWAAMLVSTRTVATQAAQLWLGKNLGGLGYPEPDPPAMIAAPEPLDVWADMSAVVDSESWSPARKPASVQYLCGPMTDFANAGQARAAVLANTAAWLDTMSRSVWPATRVGGAFDPTVLAGTAAGLQARIQQQHLRVNAQGSQRYVLSVTGSIAQRLRPDAFKAHRLFLAGDWTFNGLNAGCVEAAVMSGRQAALALHGLQPGSVPGSVDFA